MSSPVIPGEEELTPMRDVTKQPILQEAQFHSTYELSDVNDSGIGHEFNHNHQMATIKTEVPEDGSSSVEVINNQPVPFPEHEIIHNGTVEQGQMMPVALPFSPLGRNPPVTNHISNGFGVDMDQMVYSANQEHVMYQQHRMYHRAPEHFSFNQTQMNQLCQVYGTNQMCQLYGTSFVGSFVHSNGQEASPMKGRLNGYRHYTDEMHGMPQVSGHSSNPVVKSEPRDSNDNKLASVPVKNRKKSDKVRKPYQRTVFTENQLNGLSASFANKRYLTLSERADLATQLNLTQSQVKIWFQNKRAKLKRNQLKSEKQIQQQQRAQQQQPKPTTPLAQPTLTQWPPHDMMSGPALLQQQGMSYGTPSETNSTEDDTSMTNEEAVQRIGECIRPESIHRQVFPSNTQLPLPLRLNSELSKNDNLLNQPEQVQPQILKVNKHVNEVVNDDEVVNVNKFAFGDTIEK